MTVEYMVKCWVDGSGHCLNCDSYDYGITLIASVWLSVVRRLSRVLKPQDLGKKPSFQAKTRFQRPPAFMALVSHT